MREREREGGGGVTPIPVCMCVLCVCESVCVTDRQTERRREGGSARLCVPSPALMQSLHLTSTFNWMW